jgi:hypothetical protein
MRPDHRETKGRQDGSGRELVGVANAIAAVGTVDDTTDALPRSAKQRVSGPDTTSGCGLRL